MKVDYAKETNEILLERVTDILSHTIPEQKVDAMKDYHKVIRTLGRGSDWRFKPIIANLEMLYMFPGRKLHNKVIVALHDLLEEMREKRIDREIEKQRNLGETVVEQKSKKLLPVMLVVMAISLVFIFVR